MSRRPTDSPLRRLAEVGPSCLSTSELVALVLDPRRGEEPALQAACAIRDHFTAGGAEFLRAISSADPGELANIRGVGSVSAYRIHAALELGRRARLEDLPLRDSATSPRQVYTRMCVRMRDLAHEELVVLHLNAVCAVVWEEVVARGGLRALLTDAREVFRSAVVHAADSVVLVHNHPSGDPSPSPADITFTERIARAGETVGIPLVDHLIVGERSYHSFLESGMLPDADRGYAPGAIVCG